MRKLPFSLQEIAVLDDPFQQCIILIAELQLAADGMPVIFDGIPTEAQGIGDVHCRLFFTDEPQDEQLGVREKGGA